MPFVLLKQTAASVATPSTGKVSIFIDSTTGTPYYKDETGSAFSLGTSFTGGNLTSAINWKQFTAIASAATTDIGAAAGNFGHITGTTTITSLGTAPQAGSPRIVVFDGALTLTHNATSLILPTGANITTAAGDVACFVTDGSTTNWRCTEYRRASGQPLVAATTYDTWGIAVSDETTAITTGTANVTFYAPYTGTIDEVFIGLSTQSSSGSVTANVKKGGTTIFSTNPSIDASEDTSLTGTAAVLSTTSFTKGDKFTVDITAAGTGAKGLKVYLRVHY